MRSRWRIYYDTGASFDCSDGRPEDAPPCGVVVISQGRDPSDPHGTDELQQRWDWYWWHAERGEWWGSDLHGLLDHLMHGDYVRAVKQGRSVPSPRFRALMQRASEEAAQ
jgi:hypothetical protein